MRAAMLRERDEGESIVVANELLTRSFRDVVRVAGLLAGYCEHVEHNEPNSLDDVCRGGTVLRGVAVDLAASGGVSLLALYADRIRTVEESSLLREPVAEVKSSLPGFDALSRSRTWADLQSAQITHDRLFHPDVFGMPKLDQLRHYTLHVAKLSALLLEAVENGAGRQLSRERVADIAVFGVKLSTVCNERLGDEPAA